jgi:mono/diheme cytochrome c family protein
MVACSSPATTQSPASAPHAVDEHAHGEDPSARGESPTGAQDHSVSSEERATYEKARPIFEAHCAKCHTEGGAKASAESLEHFGMDAYPFSGHHAAEITSTIREVLGITGSKPTMPKDKPGAVKDEDLKVILTWADAYDRAHPAAASKHKHEHGGHEH